MIYVLCRDSNNPMGGVRMLYRHAEVLSQLGRAACVLHCQAGFRCTWFSHSASIAYRDQVRLRPSDLLVVPDEIAYQYLDYTDCPYVIFNQNPYLLLESVDHDIEVAGRLFANPSLLGVIVVSESSRHFMEHVYPAVRTLRIHYGIDTERFRPRDKQTLVSFMPRRSGESLRQVLQILRLRSVIGPDDALPIDGLDESGVQASLGETMIFLSGSAREGFGLPVAEALACGALVVGYDGEGGRELFTGPFASRVEGGDVLAYAVAAEHLIELVRGDRRRYEELASLGRRYIAERYAPEMEVDSIRRAWEALGC